MKYLSPLIIDKTSDVPYYYPSISIVGRLGIIGKGLLGELIILGRLVIERYGDGDGEGWIDGWMGLHRSIDQSINWSKIRYELYWTASASASEALFYLQLPSMNED